MRVQINYKIDNRLKLVQVNTGEVNFLLHLGEFTSRFNIDNFEHPNGVVLSTIDDYKHLYKERLL